MVRDFPFSAVTLVLDVLGQEPIQELHSCKVQPGREDGLFLQFLVALSDAIMSLGAPLDCTISINQVFMLDGNPCISGL